MKARLELFMSEKLFQIESIRVLQRKVRIEVVRRVGVGVRVEISGSCS